jgi:hypothetical protein
MTQIFFFTNNVDPAKMQNVRTISGWHVCNDAPIGVAYPASWADPNDATAEITAQGFIVLPGVHDTTTPVPAAAVAAIAKVGIVVGPAAVTSAFATAVYQKLGLPFLKPNLQ